MIKVAIVDDQELVRESIYRIMSVNKDIQVVGLGSDGYDAIKIVDACRPDVILLDVKMPIIDGIEVALTLKHRSPLTNIIILSSFDDEEYIIRSLRNGASGFILKDSNLKDLVDAVRTVYNGGGILTPSVAKKAFSLFSNPPKEKKEPGEFDTILPKSISKTELQIIVSIGIGKSNKEIADNLLLQEGTVRNYISGILQKIGLRDRTQVAIYAIKQGLVEIEDVTLCKTDSAASFEVKIQ